MGAIGVAKRVGMLGFGRFGRALGELFADAGIEVRAWDPVVPVEPPLAVDGPAGFAACDAVVLAVPVAATAPRRARCAPSSAQLSSCSTLRA